MSTIVVSLYQYIKKKTSLFSGIHELAKRCRKLCSRYDILDGKIIGLDTSKKRLLYLRHANKSSAVTEIDLINVSNCTVKKQYGEIDAGGLNNKTLQEYLLSISLELQFKNGTKAYCIPFYKKKNDKAFNTQALEEKARAWQSMVTSVLKRSSLILCVALLFISIASSGQTMKNQRSRPAKGYYSISNSYPVPGTVLRLPADTGVVPAVSKGYYAIPSGHKKRWLTSGRILPKTSKPVITKGYYSIGSNAQKLFTTD